MELQSSSYYKEKIDEFVALGKKLSGLTEHITTCNTSVTHGIEYLGEIVICNEPIDKNVLGDNVGKTLGDIADALNTYTKDFSKERSLELTFAAENMDMRISTLFDLYKYFLFCLHLFLVYLLNIKNQLH